MPGWERPKGLVFEEFKQAIEEGKHPAAVEVFRAEDEAAGEDSDANDHLHARMLALPVDPAFPYREPSDLDGIRAEAPGWSGAMAAPRDPADQIHGAWLGRCIGCVLGKPFEAMGMRGVEVDGMQPWLRLRRYLTAIDPGEWPIRGYVPGHSPAESEPAIGAVMCPDSTRERVAFAETDDDLRYSVLALMLLREKGVGFTTRDVAAGWIRHLPYGSVCTAETQAYHNLVSRYEFHAGSDFGRKPQEIDWDWVATHRNPYREWIGGQIRVDTYGYVAAGRPALAAELAWRDARLSHTKNGVYGAMFCAAMVAAAFSSRDPAEIVQAGLDRIPRGSRLAEAVLGAKAVAARHGNRFEAFESALDALHALLGRYSTVHTIPNAALCVLSVLLGGGDFHRTVTLSVMGGWDTDCNGATAGSIAGAMTGARGIPAEWSAPLHDTLRSGIADYHPAAISECARQTLEVYLANR